MGPRMQRREATRVNAAMKVTSRSGPQRISAPPVQQEQAGLTTESSCATTTQDLAIPAGEGLERSFSNSAFIIVYFYVYECLPVYMYVFHIQAWCLGRLKEGRHLTPDNGVTDCWAPIWAP